MSASGITSQKSVLDERRRIFLHFQVVGGNDCWGKWRFKEFYMSGRQEALKAFWQRENIPVVGCETREKLRWGRKKWWTCFAGWTSGTEVSRLHPTVSHVVFALMSKSIMYFVKEVNRKYYGNNNNSEHNHSQYLLRTYHMLGLRLRASYVWLYLIIPTC